MKLLTKPLVGGHGPGARHGLAPARSLLALGLLLALALPGSQTGAHARPQPYTATLQLTPSRAQVGTSVEVSGSGYPAGAEVELLWYTVEGRYELENGTEFVGQRYEPRSEVLGTVRADATGTIATRFEVPVDFGGPHDVRGRVDGQEIAQAGLMVEPTFTLAPREGPVGTPIELRITGVDLRPNLNTWHVLYDNRYFGFMSAVTTKGVATARLRAAGPIGDHVIALWNNSYNSTPYLAWDTSPFRDEFQAGVEFRFRVTEDPGPPAPVVEDFSASDNPWPVSIQGPGLLALSPDRGPVGQPLTLRGAGLPADTEVTLRWSTMVGNRVSGVGFSEQMEVLGSARTDPDGAFLKEMLLPDGLGGQHRLEAVVGDTVWAAAGLVVQPSLVSFGPTRARTGDKVRVHLKGVGWTTFENTYAVTYDNAYIGYVCGFSTNGDVQFSLTATGAPGTHLVDLYPTIYKGKEPMPRVYSVPQLTYADDHPQRITPAIRLALEVIE